MTEPLLDDMWTPYKYLQRMVESFLTGQSTDNTSLEIILGKFKQNFINLLKNSPRNDKKRDEIRKGITDGVTLPGLGHTTLSKDLVDETIIISEMYDLNEYIALELLCTAHQQMPNHPGLNRGLVAVLLYYDGRKTLVTTLKHLFQARGGISWCIESSSDVTRQISRYTESLVADGILIRIIEQLENLDITKELALLSENRALGKPKHHRQVLDLFEEIRNQLAQTLFCWSAQCGLHRDAAVRLIGYLAKYKPSDARGGIDDVTLAMLMALLYALDLSVLQKYDDSDEVVRRLPIICEPQWSQSVLEALNAPWECEELKSVVLYAFGLAMAALRQAPQIVQQYSIRIIDQDEVLVESAIQGKLFDFMYHVLLENETVFTTEFYFRRIHILITDFIELMHSKVTELRARADEAARTIQIHTQQGLDPPMNLCQNFETLLLIVGKLYSNDKMNLQLDLEYWKPMDGGGMDMIRGGGGGGLASSGGATIVGGNSSIGPSAAVSTRSVSLFKFIRLAGDLLPPTLLVPYLKMLAGLSSCQQSAQKTFDFLKQGHGVSGSTTLSWDHFFSSMTKYYANLRQEQNPHSDTVYRNRMLNNRNINPQELAGLQAVLSVIRAVATHDEFARIALCDHPNWQPLVVLLGLVTCSVVIPLKTDLLLTLAALGRSKETALQLWANLESCQIINTIPTTNTFAYRGIETELEQVECRNETYPLTTSLLKCLFTLLSTYVPKNLGAGPRRPGLDPYVTFVLHSVFLKFYNRNYKDQAEKWQIGVECLRILDYFIRTYEIHPNDFPVNDHQKEENSPPGFHVMLQMNTNDKSELLKLILHIVDEACARLDTYTTFQGKENLEQCALYCLAIIERCLAQQDLFFDAHCTANCSILIAGLNKLLLGINPRSAKPDHMLNIAKFVTYNSWLPLHSLNAIRIIGYIVRQPNVNSLLLGEFTRTESLTNEIRHGFVECLESQLLDMSGTYGEGGTSAGTTIANYMDNIDGGIIVDDFLTTSKDVEIAIKDAILNLLEDCLPQSAPNLSHYLLGFDTTKDIRLTQLQQPGVMQFPSNCTKSLITILDNGLEKTRLGIEKPIGMERLIESGYRLLYALCLNSKTSDVILRFLRSCNDFFCRHIAGLPFLNYQHNGAILNQMTGLLKTVAIELRITSLNNQVTQFANMAKNLLGVVGSGGGATGIVTNSTTVNGQYNTTYTNGENDTLMTDNAKSMNLQTDGLLICKLLECLEFQMKQVDRPKLDFFDNALIQQLLLSCEVQNTTIFGQKLINIKRLDDILRSELQIVQNTIASGQMALILQEKEIVLKYALAVNQQKQMCSATIRFLDAWGQVTDTLFSVAPVFAISNNVKHGLIIEILQSVLCKVVSLEIMPELANLASSAVLQLLVNLRHCHNQQSTMPNHQRIGGGGGVGEKSVVASFWSGAVGGGVPTKTNSLSMKYILKNLVEWILMSGGGSQRLKTNLYTAMLISMHIIKGSSSTKKHNHFSTELPNETYVSRLDKSLSIVNSSIPSGVNGVGDDFNTNDQTQMAVEVFSGVGDKIIDILCHDCTSGHDICKMLALSCIDMLLDMDPMVNFINFISRRGYLTHIVDSLIKTDQQLCRVLDNVPDNMKALYVYQSKMAMLGRVASTHIGAGLLLEHKTLGVLSQMKVFDLHPDFQAGNIHGVGAFDSGRGGGGGSYGVNIAAISFIPPVDQRYQQILFPALNLCDIVLSTLGPENRSAITQVIYFLLSHGDMIEIVLRAGTPFMSLGLLQELSAITGLIARTASQEIAALIEPGTNQDLGAHLYRLQRLMLGLFPRFILWQNIFKELEKNDQQQLFQRQYQQQLLQQQQQQQQHHTASNASGGGGGGGGDQQSLINTNNDEKNRFEYTRKILQIASNLALYARNVIANHSADHRTTGILFTPNVNEALQRSENRSSSSGTAAASLEVSPSISLVVSQLKNSVEYYNREKHAYDGMLLQRNSLVTLSLDSKNEAQFDQLTTRLLAKNTELKLCVFLTEHCLYLLWAHLDFYMLRAVPVTSYHHNNNLSGFNKSFGGGGGGVGSGGLPSSAIDAGWRVTSDEVAQLKKSLIQVLNETFCKQLMATTQNESGIDKEFVNALLRRIKRLIQFAPVD